MTGAVLRAVASVVASALERVRADAVAVVVVVEVEALGHNFNFAQFPLFHWMAVGGGG